MRNIFRFIKNKNENQDDNWKEYFRVKSEEANNLIFTLGLVIGERYKGTYFLGGVKEGVLLEVWNGYACLELDNGVCVEDICVYSLVKPNEKPLESRYIKLINQISFNEPQPQQTAKKKQL